MNKSELSEALKKSYAEFINHVDELTLDEFDFAPAQKWSAGQQVEHLIRSTSPLNLALGLPKFVLKAKFGKANRPSKTYDELIAKYKKKLEEGGRAFGKYLPPPVNQSQRAKLSKKLNHNIEELCAKTMKWSEEDLDQYILPHPLLGKVTIREILYFTIYHAHHHQILIKQYLKGV